MNITIRDKVGDLRVYYVFKDGSLLLNNGDKVKDNLKYLIDRQEFNGERSQEAYINNIDKEEKILFLGLGDKSGFKYEILRRITSQIVRTSNEKNIESLSIEFNIGDGDEIANAIKVISESITLTNYKYDKYLSDKIELSLKEVNFISMDSDAIKNALREGITLGNSTNIARNLVNEPSNKQSPIELGKQVSILGKRYGFEVEIFNEDEIIKMGMDAIYEVSKGSNNKPVFIVMRYIGDKESKEKIGLVGKGITFDTGGLDLKRGPRFIHMKHDMAGSAAVIGAMSAIAEHKLKANVIAVVAACENMISSKGYKPGDIISSMAGKSILINSTDAEGRLTLIDAIHYVIEREDVNKVINIATLTGSARRIFGPHGGIVMSNNEEFYGKIEIAAKESGEMILRLPIVEDAKENLKSDIADYINTSNSDSCGAITAGMFIGEFVQNKAWIHIDMSGPCWSDNKRHYISQGGTGWGTRLLYNMVKRLEK